MKIQAAIEKAVAGGWGKEYQERYLPRHEINKLSRQRGDTWGVWFYWVIRSGNSSPKEVGVEILLEEILLDPAFWQALGKVKSRELDEKYTTMNKKLSDEDFSKWYSRECMHRMIDALASGKTLEEYFETL